MNQENLRWFLPEEMTHAQEMILKDVSARLASYGWNKAFITEWWQTPYKSLNGYCPLEALCADKFGLVHKILDKTVRIYEANLKQIEAKKQLVKELLQKP